MAKASGSTRVQGTTASAYNRSSQSVSSSSDKGGQTIVDKVLSNPSKYKYDSPALKKMKSTQISELYNNDTGLGQAAIKTLESEFYSNKAFSHPINPWKNAIPKKEFKVRDMTVSIKVKTLKGSGRGGADAYMTDITVKGKGIPSHTSLFNTNPHAVQKATWDLIEYHVKKKL